MAQYTGGNIYSVIERNARAFPDKLLIAVENERLSNAEFVEGVEKTARALARHGITAGTKVGIIVPNSALWYTIFWAIVRLGCEPVPFDPQIGEWEMERLLGLAGIECCFTASRYRANDIIGNLKKAQLRLPGLNSIIVTDDNSTFVSIDRFLENGAAHPLDAPHAPAGNEALMLACTSGSTGNPKIIVVPHTGFGRSQADMSDYIGFNENDVMLLGMPLYHQGGFGMGLQMVLAGGAVMYQTLFDPSKFLEIVQRERITVLQLTTTLAKIILTVPGFDTFDFSSVRIAYFAGEVLPVGIAREFFDKLGVRVINVIGSTETATMVVWDSEVDRDADPNEFRALSFTDARVLDRELRDAAPGETGNIFVHTDALLREYYGNAKETEARLVRFDDGKMWFDTQDLGVRLPNGRIKFMGRAKRIIKRGSNLVYPEECEAFFLTHPDIAAVAVTGEKHELLGESIVAYIQPRKGTVMTRADIIRFCVGKLAAYKLPDKMIFTESIPHDIGKVQFKYLDTTQKGDDSDNG